ncbi:Rad4 beta-hairpin domain 3-domain-containing protein, partial [Scheffersomyces coipomensis]|uniref:Rad4 beta-hairpin domain 3-domain-containing protein n=1 Tax=Scheffersomyces coipomensis TaxID=1788519 RepID=UPI00315D519E
MVSYILHARHRNKWLSNKKILKSLKNLIPKDLIKNHVRKLQKALKEGIDNNDKDMKLQLDKQLVYILKYLIKWFRLNYKFNSNGLRVLGYLPKHKSADQYYPNTASPISNIKEFQYIIKKFKHNRDTGAQIFTALLRSLGFESRLVFSLPLLAVRNGITPLKQPKVDEKKLSVNKDNDLLYPYYWTELINPLNPEEVIVLETECFHNEENRLIRLTRVANNNTSDIINQDNLNQYYTDLFYPVPSQFNQMSMHYVISLTNDNLILPISSRYMTDISYRWFDKLDLRTDHGRSALLFQSLIRIFNHGKHYDHLTNLELDTLRKVAMINYKIPTNFTAMKRNPNVVTLSTLRYNESIPTSTTTPISKIKLDSKLELVYFKNSIVVGKSIKQWKFLGRSVKPTELDHPLKSTKALTPRTIEGKRLYNLNIYNNEPELNETKLYSFDQTCPYITLETTLDINGNLVLPRNKYGNMEIYRENMVPENCMWLKLSDIETILNDYRKTNDLKIQYVNVVVGFNFTSKPGQCIPVKNGVIILKQDELLIKKIWLQGKMRLNHLELESKKKETEAMWELFIRRVRIKEKLNKRYG